MRLKRFPTVNLLLHTPAINLCPTSRCGMPVKILLVGSVAGNIDQLTKRVTNANEKAGPFEAVLCVGRFFAEGDASAACPAWFSACVNGTTALAVPTYFVGGDGVRFIAYECAVQMLDAAGIGAIGGSNRTRVPHVTNTVRGCTC